MHRLAAAGATLAVALAACGGGAPTTDPTAAPSATGSPAGDTTSPDPDASTGVTPSPSASSTPDGDDVRETTFPTEGLGRGVVVGVSPDGAGAYVVAEHPRLDATGCEGEEAQHLWLVDLATGARSSAVPEDDYPVSAAPISNGRGQAVLADQCEGYLWKLSVATQGLDGRLSQLRELEIDQDVDAQAWTFGWSRDGSEILFSTNADFSKDGRTSQVYRLDPETSVLQVIVDLPHAGVVAQLSDGSYAIETNGDVVIVGGAGNITTRYEGYAGLSVGPDDTLALIGQAAGLALAPPGGPAVTIADHDLWEVRWSADGSRLSYLHDADKGEDFVLALDVIDREGKRTKQFKQVGFSGGFFDLTGKRLIYTALGDDPTAYPSGVPTVGDL